MSGIVAFRDTVPALKMMGYRTGFCDATPKESCNEGWRTETCNSEVAVASFCEWRIDSAATVAYAIVAASVAHAVL